MLSVLLIVVLAILLIGALPGLGYHNYGYGPTGGIGLILVIVLVLVLLGRL